VTFRPEQRGWKDLVHRAPVAETDDPARAARRIMTDDGFNLGVLYAGNRAVYARPSAASTTPALIEAEFAVGAEGETS
jgi:2-oxoglutarate ferredoxin oxidoreductase subunit beta